MFFSARDWLFSAKAFLASMLALFIALSLDLPRPYWAMAAVYIVANPLAGATSSKGLYRALGTLLGATAAVLLVPLFVNAPELLSVVIALWTGTLLFISMLDRTSRSYVFMLAGYSLPLIALPAVGAPETVFDIALSRSEEIIIGITCASVVSAVVFPTSVGTAHEQRIRTWLDDAGAWAYEILRGEGATPSTPLKRQKLAADIAGLDLVISQLAYDAGTRDIVRHARELRSRLLMLLPLFSSLADRLHGLKASRDELPDDISAILTDVATWLSKGGSGPADGVADRLIREIERLEAQDFSLAWNDLLRASALARLKEIINLWQDCLSLRDQLALGSNARPWLPTFRHRRVVARVRHYDYALLAFAAGSVVASTIVASFFWIASGWQNGAGFVTMVAVAGSFFAAMDRPAPFINMMFKFSVVSVVIAFIYLFGILPAVNSYELLVVVFAPPFLLLGLLIPKPQYNMLGMLLAVNSASFIALQDRYTADFTTFTNESIAALAGMGFALAWALVARPFGAELAARRLVLAGWTDLAETAAGERHSDHERLAGRILDRLGQLVPRLAAIDDRDLKTVDGYADVRLGFNVLMLQQERSRLDRKSAVAVGAVLGGISDFYRHRASTGEATPPPALLCREIDQGLETVITAQADDARPTIDALVGIRRALFPDMPPPDARWPVTVSPVKFPIAAE